MAGWGGHTIPYQSMVTLYSTDLWSHTWAYIGTVLSPDHHMSESLYCVVRWYVLESESNLV